MRFVVLSALLCAFGVGCAYDLDSFTATEEISDATSDGSRDSAVGDALVIDSAVVDVLDDTPDDEAGVNVTTCKSASDYAGCFACCADRLPAGAKKTWQQAGDCLCNSAHCKSKCADTACSKKDLSSPDLACAKCVGAALAGSCGKAVAQGKQFQACVAACPGGGGGGD
ncbi:MAG: hypothetical protein IPJ34_05820 [Myxococcales bacterium]|nr:hypothetical protein [Myxococcales bacterium]